MHRLGVHLSIAKGISKIFDIAKSLGCNCTQIFSHSPRSWRFTIPTEEEVREFRRRYRSEDIRPIFIHQSYLVNLASPNKEVYQRSLESIKREAEFAKLLGLRYIVIHPGSHLGKGEKLGLKNIVNALDSLSDHLDGLEILLETTAGARNIIGSRFEHLAYIIENSVVACGVAFDTCHLYSAGYDVSSEEGLEDTLRSFDSMIGIKKLKLIHLNDSKGGLGSNIDRHEHIGLGRIGLEGFRRIVNHRHLKDKPMILETPMDGKRSDKENLDVVRSLIGSL